MYPRTKVVLIGQVGIVVLVLFSYPLQLHPARASLDKFLFPHRVALADDDRDDGSNAEEDCSHGGGGGDEIPLGRFVLESAALLFATFLIAMFVSSLEIVLGFVGATGSTTISFILPSVFCTSSGLGVSPQRTQNPSETDQDVCAWEPVLSLFKDSESPHDRRLRLLALLLLSWGICVMVVSLSLNICAFSLMFSLLGPGWAGAKRGMARKLTLEMMMVVGSARTGHLVQPTPQGSLHTLGQLGGKVLPPVSLPLPAAEGGAA